MDEKSKGYPGHDEGSTKAPNGPPNYNTPGTFAPLPDVPSTKDGYGTHGETGGSSK